MHLSRSSAPANPALADPKFNSGACHEGHAALSAPVCRCGNMHLPPGASAPGARLAWVTSIRANGVAGVLCLDSYRPFPCAPVAAGGNDAPVSAAQKCASESAVSLRSGSQAASFPFLCDRDRPRAQVRFAPGSKADGAMIATPGPDAASLDENVTRTAPLHRPVAGRVFDISGMARREGCATGVIG